MTRIAKLGDVNAGHEGSTIFIKQGDSYYPALRIEIRGNTAFNLNEAQTYNLQGKPYIPDSEKSVYIKTPPGSLYTTNLKVHKFNHQGGKVTLDGNSNEKIFNPYISWHGGMGGKDLNSSKGLVSIRGINHDGTKARHIFNSVEAIAKDSFAGNYNPIASVTFPRTINSFPAPVDDSELYQPIHPANYVDSTFSASAMLNERHDLVIDYGALSRKGMSVVFCVHNPSPAHKSRFPNADRSKWIYEPVTYTLFDDVALACSVFFVECDVEIVLDDAPLVFVGYAMAGKENIASTVFKV